jgi:hypothetical protein
MARSYGSNNLTTEGEPVVSNCGYTPHMQLVKPRFQRVKSAMTNYNSCFHHWLSENFYSPAQRFRSSGSKTEMARALLIVKAQWVG